MYQKHPVYTWLHTKKESKNVLEIVVYAFIATSILYVLVRLVATGL